MQVRFVARGDLQGRGLDLDEPLRLEIASHRCERGRPHGQPRSAVGVTVAAPERRGAVHGVASHDLAGGNRQLASDLVFGGEIGMLRAAFAQAIV
jgi:hypothetical protein